MNNTAMNTVCKSLYELVFSVLLGKYLGIELPDYMVNLCLTLKKYQTVFQSWSTSLHSHQQYMRFLGALLPCHYLVLSFFLIGTIVVGEQ